MTTEPIDIAAARGALLLIGGNHQPSELLLLAALDRLEELEREAAELRVSLSLAHGPASVAWESHATASAVAREALTGLRRVTAERDAAIKERDIAQTDFAKAVDLCEEQAAKLGKMECTWCGLIQTRPYGFVESEAAAHALAVAHAETCEKSPLRAARAEVTRLQLALSRVLPALTRLRERFGRDALRLDKEHEAFDEVDAETVVRRALAAPTKGET